MCNTKHLPLPAIPRPPLLSTGDLDGCWQQQEQQQRHPQGTCCGCDCWSQHDPNHLLRLRTKHPAPHSGAYWAHTTHHNTTLIAERPVQTGIRIAQASEVACTNAHQTAPVTPQVSDRTLSCNIGIKQYARQRVPQFCLGLQPAMVHVGFHPTQTVLLPPPHWSIPLRLMPPTALCTGPLSPSAAWWRVTALLQARVAARVCGPSPSPTQTRPAGVRGEQSCTCT